MKKVGLTPAFVFKRAGNANLPQRTRPSPPKEAGRGGRPGKAKAGRSAAPEAPRPDLKWLAAALEPHLGPLAASLGLEAVSCRPAVSEGRPAIRVVIDTPAPEGGGPHRGSQVTLDQCAALSRRLSRLLDELDPSAGPGYSLEVSSPGLDRPLSTEAEFRRFDGALAKLGLAIDGRTRRLTGRLATSGSPWRLITGEGEVEFDIGMVKSARLAPET
jgi:ribosome maturation factor RimP